MSLSSREVVNRAIEFRKPDRLPVRFEKLGISDVYDLPVNQVLPWEQESDQNLDEWGCLWVRKGTSNMGQVKGYPLKNWTAMETYEWPNPDNPGLYERIEYGIEECNDRYILITVFGLLFERMHFLRGMENVFLDLYSEKERIEKLADRIVEYDLGLIHNLSSRFSSHIQGLGFTDDWGTEKGLLINPEMWKEFFKPRYARIFGAIHQAGWHIWMHSCGKVNDIIQDLIDIGVNVINLGQPRVLGIEEIGKRFSGHICFVTLCDIQHTLPFATKTEIFQEAQLLLRHWATEKGGFILSDYGEGEAIGVPDEKRKLMLKVFQELDPWRSDPEDN